MRLSRHYLIAIAIIVVGAVLRFAQLQAKPLWLDEIMTALFSLGRSYNEVPLDRAIPVTKFADIFTLNSGTTCAKIAETLATESTHPPLFFCLTHEWLSRIKQAETDTLQPLICQLRSLSALFGIGAIAAMYGLNRVAFSPQAGLISAAAIAVSPFAVYLSQEARHYSLPMLLITLSLLTLIQIQRDLLRREKVRSHLWILWVIFNTIGLYTHYFYLLALVAQILTLILVPMWQKRKWLKYFIFTSNKPNLNPHLFKTAIAACAFSLLPFILYLPWIPQLLNHFNRPETDWFKPFQPSWTDSITPIFQTFAGWLTMTIAFPVENQPVWIVIPSALLMLIFAVWLVRYLLNNFQLLLTAKGTNFSSLILATFTICVILEYLAIVYLLGKDITSAFRYHFTYYPSICALLGAILWQSENTRHLSPIQTSFPRLRVSPSFPLFLVLVVGFLSSLFVVSGFVFQKPYDPHGVVQTMNLEPAAPLMVVVGYENTQEIALGLSFALELDEIRGKTLGETPPTYFALMKRSPHYQQVWQQLSQLQKLPSSTLNLWIIAPGLRQKEYPPQLALANQRICTLDPTQYYRLGIPYQLYRCSSSVDAP